MNTGAKKSSTKEYVPIIVSITGLLILGAVLLFTSIETPVGKILAIIGSVCAISGFIVWNERK